ncbi:hypothetical protein D3C80_643130 [compost metagenome]
MLGQQQPQQADGQDGGHHGGGHVEAILEVVLQLPQHGIRLAGLGEPGGQRRLPAAHAGRQRLVGLALVRHGTDGGDPRQDGGDDEGDHQGGPEVEVPVPHQVEGLGHYDHEGGGDGGEAGGDDDGFPYRVLAREEDPVGDEQAHRVAADEGGDRIDGGVARGAPEGAHHRLHQYADKLQQAEAEQEGKGHGADGHDEPHRHGQLVKEERQAIRRHQPGGAPACHIHDGQPQPEQLEQAQHPVDGAGAPATIQQRADGAIGDQQQDEPQGERALRHQEARQVIHQYGAAARELEGHEKDGDAEQAGQQQFDASPRTGRGGECVFRFHFLSL